MVRQGHIENTTSEQSLENERREPCIYTVKSIIKIENHRLSGSARSMSGMFEDVFSFYFI